MTFTRREVLGAALGLAAAPALQAARVRVATFSADVTPPLGHPLLAGLCLPAASVADPLFVRGIVLAGPDKPVVVACVDWCEIRNDAHDRWREALAGAAGTTPDRVLVAAVHPHDAPLADLEAQRILGSRKLPSSIIDLEYHERAVSGAAAALREGLKGLREATHVGLGQARVREVASNRRTLGKDGRPRFDRMSATRDPALRAEPEGTIDPWLKTLSFWDGERPLAALSVYAVHPMSYYRTGRVSADFPGLARKRRQDDDPAVFQVYGSGCSGNVIAGKYNDGAPENRPVLAERLHKGMAEAWEATRRQPLEKVRFASTPLRLEPRDSPGYTVADLEKKLVPGTAARDLPRAALGLSWRKRADAGRKLDVPAVDFGPAQLVLLPAESYVEYQLLAQRLRPDSFVVVLGYGECAPGYIPTEQHWKEGDNNLDDWCWTAPGAEARMTEALEAALKAR